MAARIGVITISSREANSINNELTTMTDLLRNVVEFLFALFAVRDRKLLAREGRLKHGEAGLPHGFTFSSKSPQKLNLAQQRFVTEVIGPPTAYW